ncbi:hypothetical protein ACFVYE_04555 [Streptomyces sp. NPDC058239]
MTRLRSGNPPAGLPVLGLIRRCCGHDRGDEVITQLRRPVGL